MREVKLTCQLSKACFSDEREMVCFTTSFFFTQRVNKTTTKKKTLRRLSSFVQGGIRDFLTAFTQPNTKCFKVQELETARKTHTGQFSKRCQPNVLVKREKQKNMTFGDQAEPCCYKVLTIYTLGSGQKRSFPFEQK